MGIDVPAADVQPPETVPVIGLQSVRFTMSLLKPGKPRLKVNRRHLKKETSSNITSNPVPGRISGDTSRDPSPERSQAWRTFEESDIEDVLSISPGIGDTLLMSSGITTGSGKKPETSVQQGKKRKRRSTTSVGRLAKPGMTCLNDFSEMEKLVDGAMRLSVSNGPLRLAQGVKVVTHTFAGNLADLCPAMWSPQYLLVIPVPYTHANY
jgi:hypothetical protein